MRARAARARRSSMRQRLLDRRGDSAAGSCPIHLTPTSSTTSGSAPARVVTGTQPASIASATDSPNPSWAEA